MVEATTTAAPMQEVKPARNSKVKKTTASSAPPVRRANPGGSAVNDSSLPPDGAMSKVKTKENTIRPATIDTAELVSAMVVVERTRLVPAGRKLPPP